MIGNRVIIRPLEYGAGNDLDNAPEWSPGTRHHCEHGPPLELRLIKQFLPRCHGILTIGACIHSTYRTDRLFATATCCVARVPRKLSLPENQMCLQSADSDRIGLELREKPNGVNSRWYWGLFQDSLQIFRHQRQFSLILLRPQRIRRLLQFPVGVRR
jgi:hypothetical protein